MNYQLRANNPAKFVPLNGKVQPEQQGPPGHATTVVAVPM